MSENERLNTCSTCQEESCVCHEICDKCKGWSAQCECAEEALVNYFCKDCKEIRKPELEVDRVEDNTIVFPICPDCGSENVVPADGMYDTAEYSKGNR